MHEEAVQSLKTRNDQERSRMAQELQHKQAELDRALETNETVIRQLSSAQQTIRDADEAKTNATQVTKSSLQCASCSCCYSLAFSARLTSLVVQLKKQKARMARVITAAVAVLLTSSSAVQNSHALQHV